MGKTKQQTLLNKEAAKVTKWVKEIEFVENSKSRKAFETIGEKIVKTYRNASVLEAYASPGKSFSRVMMNVLWSNVQIQKPLLFARMPKIACERMHKDSDPVGRLAATLVERGMTAVLAGQKERFMWAVRSAVEDRLLPGMGSVWVRYDADFGTNQDQDPVSGPELGPNAISGGSDDEPSDAEIAPEQFVKPYSERVIFDYQYWEDFAFNTSRNWYEVRAIWKRAYMTRAQLIKRFGPEIGKKVKLSHNPQAKSRKELTDVEREMLLQAEVYEVWDSETKTVYWINKDYEDRPLDEEYDPYELEGFFPCPMPLLATTTTDSLYPTPDYKIYERLAEELDNVTFRISAITDCIKVVGLHAASIGEDVKNMLNLRDGQTWPVKNWVQFMQDKGGLQGAINWFTFDSCVAALPVLTQYQQNILAQVDSITGIPDIARGGTDPTETAAAIQRKSKWTMLKATEKQGDVQRFCKELIVKAAEIVFNPKLVTQETLALLCGVEQLPPDDQQLYPEAIALLQNDGLRTFRIDIETDSTIAIDEDEDQASRMEYVQAVTQLVQSIESVQQFRPELMDPMVQSMLFAVRSFRTGRPLEASWERAMKQIEDNDAQAKQQPPPPPQPDPNTMAQVQVEQMKIQQDGELKAQQIQLDSQKAQADFELKSQELQLKAQEIMGKQSNEEFKAQLKQFETQFNQALEKQRLALQEYATVQSERESMLEEQRLAKEQNLEAIRLVHERLDGMAANPKEEAKPPVIHIHNGSGAKEYEMVRGVDGVLRGRSREVN